MVVNRLHEIPFADMIENMVVGIIDSQIALDINGIITEKLLSNIKLPAKSVIIAIVETVDQNGNIINIQPLLNEKPLSLTEFGLSPVFLQISEITVSIEFVTYFRETEPQLNPIKRFLNQFVIARDSSYVSFNRNNWTEFYLNLFRHSQDIPTFPEKEKPRHNFRLAVSSATSVAVSSKVKGEMGVWRMRATVRPKKYP